jgi:hypothetical protein
MLKTFTISFLSIALAAALGACGDDSSPADASTSPDAPTSDAGLDAAPTADADLSPDAYMPPGAPSCDELTTPSSTISTFPGTYNGNIVGKLANLNVTACDVENAPFGVDAPGEDEVVKLTGLTPGTTYYAKISSEEDLAVYVLTGCNAGSGDGACLSFADANTGNAAEAAKFTAPPDGTAYAVVDFWDASAMPTSGAYTLTVTTDGCTADADCSPAHPVCDTTQFSCVKYDNCVGDDAAEGDGTTASDDGPIGATNIAYTPGTPVVINGGICDDVDPSAASITEFDWWKITVPDGGGFTASLGWADTAADLDLIVTDATGALVGESYWLNAEVVKTSHLPAGTYFLHTYRYAPTSTAVTPYTLTVDSATAACTTDADCDDDFSTQVFRGHCNAGTGACENLAGNAMVALGGKCDGAGDCDATALGCTTQIDPFQSNLSSRGFCTNTCTTDSDCASMPNAVCMTIDPANATKVCAGKCTADTDCGVGSLLDQPTMGSGLPWLYVTCTVMTGQCNY